MLLGVGDTTYAYLVEMGRLFLLHIMGLLPGSSPDYYTFKPLESCWQSMKRTVTVVWVKRQYWFIIIIIISSSSSSRSSSSASSSSIVIIRLLSHIDLPPAHLWIAVVVSKLPSRNEQTLMHLMHRCIYCFPLAMLHEMTCISIQQYDDKS